MQCVDVGSLRYLSCLVGNILVISIFDKFWSPSTRSLEIPRFSVYLDLFMLRFALCIDLFMLRFAVCIDLFRQRFENCCLKNQCRQQTAP